MKKSYLPKGVYVKAKILFFIFLSVSIRNGLAQSVVSWTNAAALTGWITPSNWSTNAYPSVGDLAQFNNTGTANNVAIDMSTLSGSLSIAGIEITNLRAANNLTVGNSSAVNGTLNFSGGNINAIPNAIIRNGSGKNLIIQDLNGGTGLMGITISNITDNKVILDGAGNITLASIISGASNSPLSVQGIGSGVVNITGVANTFSGNINLLGVETVFSADGSFGAIPAAVTPSAIIIDGGRMTANLTYTLNSNRGIQLGQTVGSSLSVKTGTSILTYNGIMSDRTTNGFLAKQGGNILQLGGVSVYTGSTAINNGRIRLLNGNDRLPITTTLNIGQAASTNIGMFDLNGFSQQVAGLNSIIGTNASAAKNTVTATTSSTLVINAISNYSYTYGNGTAANSGIIIGATTIVKNGTGLQILGDINSYSGETIINGGELRFSPTANENLNTSSVTLNGGTLGTQSITANANLSFATLKLTNNSIINLEAINTHSLNFLSSNSIVWTAAKTITITGWQGTYTSASGSPGTVGRIFVGSTATDLTLAQLSQIVFFNGTNYFASTLLSNGELVPYCIAPVNNSVSSNTPCVGSNLNLSASATGTLAPIFSWVGPNSFSSNLQNPSIIAATSAATGIYSVTSTNGCGATTTTISVTINPTPTLSINSVTICSGGTATLVVSGANTYTWNTTSNSPTIVVTLTVPTTYTVNATSTQGCFGSVTTAVALTNSPSISVGSATICVGKTATLTASGVSTYTWSTNSNAQSITLNPTVTTTYSVSGNASGCPVTASNTATVFVNPNPTVTLNSLGGPFCINSPTIALSGSPASGTFVGTGVSGNVFDPSIAGAGTFTITYNYTNANNCSNSDAKPVSVSLCTGLNEVSQNSLIKIYPNPVNDKLFISNSTNEISKIIIVNTCGQTVLSFTDDTKQSPIDVSSLTNGIYFIYLNNLHGENKAVLKFVKN